MNSIADQMLSSFRNIVENDVFIKHFYKKVDEEKANDLDVHNYSVRLGKDVASAIKMFITYDNFPDGIKEEEMKGCIVPLYQDVHRLVNDYATKVQTYENKRKRIGLKPIRSVFPYHRINDLASKYTEVFNKGVNDAEEQEPEQRSVRSIDR